MCLRHHWRTDSVSPQFCTGASVRSHTHHAREGQGNGVKVMMSELHDMAATSAQACGLAGAGANPAHVPRSGATVFVCGQECAASVVRPLLASITTVRPDVRAVVPSSAELPGLEHLLLCLEISGRTADPAACRSLRTAVRWSDRSGSLLVFPAGDRSLWTDTPPLGGVRRWDDTVARIIRMTGATTVPVHAIQNFPGELDVYAVRFGDCIPAGRISADNSEALNYLRWCADWLDPNRNDPGRLVPRIVA